MKREMRDLQAQLAKAEQEVRFAISEGRIKDAEKGMEEVRALRKQIAMLEELEAMERKEIENAIPAGERRDFAELQKEYQSIFMKAIRRKPLNIDEIDVIRNYRQQYFAVMHEGGVSTDPDGDTSLLVPQDIQTRINTLMRSLTDLSQYISVETVTTLSGSRVLEADETMTPLQKINEYDNIPAMNNPKFVPIDYKLEDYAGFLPITNSLLQDSDQNIINYITNWIAKKVVVTRNTEIIALLNTLTAKTLADLKAIKHVFNVDLEPDISRTSVVITNQDGFNWLDIQTDQQGRFILQDDITRPGEKMLFGRPVVVMSNRYLPSREDTTAGKTYAPIYIGNGKQFAVWFTRGTYELASTKEGGEAWRRNSTELRVITRDDLVTWDAAAMIKGELDVTVAV